MCTRKDKRGNRIRWKFIAWKDLYWENSIGHDDDYDSIMQFGNRTHLYILSGVTILLLLVGILNFINIYMVFMMKRSKEYGVKKVFGLQRLPLFLQIWMENQLLAFAALLTAWLLIEATQVPVSRLMNEQISYSAFDWKLSLGFIILLPLVTSIYPYIRYNYLPPIVSIRSITSNRHAITVRMTFLFFQYVITILLLILSFYFGKQLHFLLNTSPGYRTERILRAELLHENKNYLRSETEEKRNERFARQDRIKQLLNECPHIEMWMSSHYSILRGSSICMLLNDQDTRQPMLTLFPSPQFFQLYDLKVLEGEIPQKFEGWSDYKMVLNKAAMKAMGYAQLEDAFVRSESPLWISVSEKGEMEEGGTKLMPVVAVIDDYYPSHLTEGIKPMAFVVGPSSGNSDFLIAVNPDKEKEVIEYLKKTEKEIYQILKKMNEVQRHRGPDDEGIFLENGCALGHVRLSILDLYRGHQPMCKKKEGNTYAIILNGEIYNMKTLKEQLIKEGEMFSTTSDTEVVLTGYIRYGISYIEELNGIFSIALWDGKRKKLYLIRDRVGVKPLFYTKRGDTLIFASEIKGLFAYPGVKPVINREGLCEIFGLGPAKSYGKGVFKDIYEVLPGHFLEYDREGLKDRAYWELKAKEHTDSEKDTIEHTRWLVKDAVEMQMLSDIPISTFLSGGVDSSLVTANLCEKSFKKEGKNLNTFSFDL